VNSGFEDHVDLRSLSFKRVIDDFARRNGGVAVTVLALGIESPLGVEEGEAEIVGEFGEVLILPFQFTEKFVFSHRVFPFAARWPREFEGAFRHPQLCMSGNSNF
jgi:hypothetical protein